MAESDRAEELSRLRHDLRTPLTIVMGFAELLGTERPLADADRREDAQRVLSAAGEIRARIDGARLD